MSDRIRVLLVIGEMSGGGSERQTLGILKHLDRTSFEPHLYLISPGGELLPEVPGDVPVSIFWQRHRRPRLNWPGRIHRAQVADLVRVIREQQIDVLYDRTYHMTMITAVAARRTGVPRASVIVSNPQVDFETNRERFAGIKRAMLRRAYRDAEQVVAVSEGTRQLAADYFHLPLERIRTIYNFVDRERLEGGASDVSPGFTRGDGRFHLLAVGRLHEAKGYTYLLEAVRRLVHERHRTQVMLHILGTGPLGDELQLFVMRHRLQEHVQLAGFQDNPFAFYRQAHLFVLSSTYEGMPNVLIEAMMAGTPVLATDCPSGPREVLAGGKYGSLVPPANAAALAEAIEDSIEHPERWWQRADEARRDAMETFGPEAGIARVEALLRELRQGAQSERPNRKS